MYDLLFRHATIVDGTGALRYTADLAVQGDAIAAIGKLDEAQARRTIDATGLVLCPGFIDVHSHADLVVFRDNAAELFEPLLQQGITTFVGGNCGMGLAPVIDGPNRKYIDAYFEAFTAENLTPLIKWSTHGELTAYLDRQGVPVNTALLAPHGVMRLGAVGAREGHANRDEIAQMQRWVAQAMEQGAFGLSTGLQYVPGNLSDTGELIDLAKVVARYGGRFTCHLRSYSATLQKAVDELVLIGQEGGLPVQLSHLFWVPDFGVPINRLFRLVALAGSKVYERVKFPVPTDSAASKVLAQVAALRKSGAAQIAVDAMPTSAGFTHLIAFFPPTVFAQAADLNLLLATLKDKRRRREIRREIETGDTFAWPHDTANTWSMNFFKIMGYDSVSIMSVPSEKNRQLEGLTLVDIGRMWKMHPFDAACELLVQEGGRVLVFETLTHPGDDFVETSLHAPMTDPNTSVVTDSILMGFGLPSHLFYDCFPKFIQRYVRETKAVTLEDGIRKCTGLPAESLGVKRRGELKPGNFADLVLFDLATIKTNSTAKSPRHFPDGVKLVVVNGKVVVDHGQYHKAAMAGKVLRRA